MMTDAERKAVFSHNLNQILSKSEKTQIEVAKAIGVSQQTFNTWCRAVALPRMGKIQLLADYFRVNMSDLIERRSDRPADPPVLSHEAQLIGVAYDNANEGTKDSVAKLLDVERDSSKGGADIAPIGSASSEVSIIA